MIVVGRHDRNAPKTAHRARQGFNAGGAVAVVVRDENVHAGQKSSRRPTERWVYRSAHGRNSGHSGHSGLWNFWIVAHCRSRSWSERAAEVFLCRNLLQAPYAAAARSFLNRTTAGHEENADLNASRVIRKRSVKMILEGLVKKKESKKLLRVPRAKKRNIGGGSPRIDACKALRVFLRPSRRWNRDGFESGSRRRVGQRIKKLRPSGRRVFTRFRRQKSATSGRPSKRSNLYRALIQF